MSRREGSGPNSRAARTRVPAYTDRSLERLLARSSWSLHDPTAATLATAIALLAVAVASTAVVAGRTPPQTGQAAPAPLAPFTPTPQEVVDRMLQMAEVTKDDVVYDLGSGDGRLVITAAKRYGARGVGVDIDPALIARSRDNARREGVDKLVEFRQQDALTVDVSPRAW